MIPLYAGQERRMQKRYRCCGPVKVIHPLSRLAVPATISDISLSGCSLHLRRAELLDSNSQVELNFTTSYFAFRVLGSVRSFTADELLVRLSFVHLNQRAWSDILAFIRDQGDVYPQPSQHLSAQLLPA